MYKRNRTAFLLSLLQQKESYPGILFAFSTTLMIRQKIHREDLPEPSGSYKEMLKHQHKEGFFAAMKLELENVSDSSEMGINSTKTETLTNIKLVYVQEEIYKS
jgi:hypothetical protein